ncbi:MAG: nucleoside kinase [Firmicutes bacterium]|nr:nucleoside kinase [Bacillota bacterium]
MSIASNHYLKYTARLEAINREAAARPEALIGEVEENFRVSIEEIALRARSRSFRLILLAGPSSSGKTTASHLLTDYFQTMNIHSHVISLDDFFLGRGQAPLLPNGRPDFESLEALDVARTRQCLADLVEKGQCEMPVFNFTTGAPEPFTRSVSVGRSDVVIVEGLHALNPILTENLPPESFLRVYISVKQGICDANGEIIRARQIRLLRRMVRDYYYRACSPERTLEMWEDVCRGEDLYIQPFKRQADLTVNSLHLYEPCIFRVLALPLLEQLQQQQPQNLKVENLLQQLSRFEPLDPSLVPKTSLLQEFIG